MISVVTFPFPSHIGCVCLKVRCLVIRCVLTLVPLSLSFGTRDHTSTHAAMFGQFSLSCCAPFSFSRGIVARGGRKGAASPSHTPSEIGTGP